MKFLEIDPHSSLHARPFLKCCQQLLLITTTNTFFYFITTILKLCHASTLSKTFMCSFCLVSKTHHIPNRVGMGFSIGSQCWNQIWVVTLHFFLLMLNVIFWHWFIVLFCGSILLCRYSKYMILINYKN